MHLETYPQAISNNWVKIDQSLKYKTESLKLFWKPQGNILLIMGNNSDVKVSKIQKILSKSKAGFRGKS